jgi:predicted protein tyrosine phosphatase
VEKLGVEVYGQDELYNHLRRGGSHYDCLISIGNPYDSGSSEDTRMPLEFTNFFRKILRLEFHDADVLVDNRKIPEIDDIYKIMGFFNSTMSMVKGYTIHCRQGVSRSTAVALCFLYMIHGSEKVAKNMLLKIRPQAVPLRRILRFFDIVNGTNLTKVGAEITNMYFEVLRKELKDMEISAKKDLDIKPRGLLARATEISREHS